jgi:hypothetical protein
MVVKKTKRTKPYTFRLVEDTRLKLERRVQRLALEGEKTKFAKVVNTILADAVKDDPQPAGLESGCKVSAPTRSARKKR